MQSRIIGKLDIATQKNDMYTLRELSASLYDKSTGDGIKQSRESKQDTDIKILDDFFIAGKFR
jgi:hypothetical protein